MQYRHIGLSGGDGRSLAQVDLHGEADAKAASSAAETPAACARGNGGERARGQIRRVSYGNARHW